MCDKYYFCQADSPVFKKIKLLTDQLISDVRSEIPDAAQQAIRLMFETISLLPINLFKDPLYTNQVFEAIRAYLESGNIQKIKDVARKRKTDRLEMRRAIACDCLEYLSFLPLRLEADPNYICHYYVETLDNIVWLLDKNTPRILSSNNLA